MQKSVFLTLFLMGSLLMSTSSAVLTSNGDLLSNTALAQEYDNNNYNNYEDDSNEYSKYPTEINKYECQTGPFEGFFVSSVEFCKIDFSSNNRDNINGDKRTQQVTKDQQVTKAPTGDKGPTGDPGQPGNTTGICPSNTTLQLQPDPDVNGLVITCAPDSQFVYITWYDNSTSDGNFDIFFARSTDNGQTFSPPENLSQNNGSSSNPKIAIQGNNVYVVWEDETSGIATDIFFARSINNGQTFSPPINISETNDSSLDSSRDPQIVTLGTNVYVVWEEGSRSFNTEIFLTRSINNGQTFSTPDNISENNGGSLEPQIAIQGNSVYVVWEDETLGPGIATDILFARSINNGQTFSTPDNISENNGTSSEAQIAVQGNNVYVVWRDDTPSNSEIFFSRSINNGQTFSTPDNISENNGSSREAQIALQGNNVNIVWEDFTTGVSEIFFSRSINNGQTFSAHLLI